MKGYIIKGTILTGDHAGTVYYLNRHGFAVFPNAFFWREDVYVDESHTKAVCTRMEKRNKLYYDCETADRDHKRKDGYKVTDWRIYELESYEPYEVSCHD